MGIILRDVELALGLADLDVPLISEEPPQPTEESFTKRKAYFQKWEKANRLSIMIMKKSNAMDTPISYHFVHTTLTWVSVGSTDITIIPVDPHTLI